MACGAPLVGNKSGIHQMGLDFCDTACRDCTDIRREARTQQVLKFGGGGARNTTQEDYGWKGGHKRGSLGGYRRTWF